MNTAPTIWGLHHNGGRPLVQDEAIALGWFDAGDLTSLPNDREAFKQRLRDTFPSKSENWVANAAGQLLRFRYVMKSGDLVVYPRKSDSTINIGRITGDYVYDAATWPEYPNRRPVEWLKTELARDQFTQAALYEIGSAMSVFMVTTHDDEITAALGQAPPPGQSPPAVGAASVSAAVAPPGEDEPSVDRITQLTRDFILRTFKTELKGHPFAEFCGWLLQALGYTAQVSPPGADQGIDIVATEDPLGVKQPAVKVQCKSGMSQSGSPEVQALNGTLAPTDQGLFISVSGFTGAARQVAAGMPRMRLMTGEDLVDLVLDHYAALPDEAKQALPLRRVWMPDSAPVEE